MISITINGKNENIENTTLVDYLSLKNINIDTIVVEINQKIIPKKDINKTQLNENDKIEIIRFVGGG